MFVREGEKEKDINDMGNFFNRERERRTGIKDARERSTDRQTDRQETKTSSKMSTSSLKFNFSLLLLTCVHTQET